jgi:CheY-like chemotaxis protein
MNRLPFPLKFSLAASAGILFLAGLALAGAAFSRRADLILGSAILFGCAAVGCFLFAAWQTAQYLRERQPKPERRRFRLARPDAQRTQNDAGFPGPAHAHEPDPAADEQDLRRTQKLEAFERLRDGIVHDLNNKLMVISANVDSVARQMKEQPALQRKLLSALVASDQAAELIARSAAFARDHPRIEQIDLAERLSSIAGLMSRSLLRDTVELRLSLDEALWPVEAGQDELETAIVSLSAYARDSLEQGGVITLEAHNVQIPKGSLTDINLGGDFVKLVISSASPEGVNRPGVDAEQSFSVADMDLSAWQRLSRSLQFLKPLGGAAEVRNTETGTAITLYLPRAQGLSAVLPGALPDLDAENDAVRRDTEILVVDDEVEVALALQAMLEETGYVTRVATNARQAMKSLQARKPALVLTDVSMPGTMNGLMLAREVRQIFPDLPVLLITGNPAVAEGEGEYPLLQKPIVSRDLHAAIQRHLKPLGQDNNVVPLFPRLSRHTS